MPDEHVNDQHVEEQEELEELHEDLLTDEQPQAAAEADRTDWKAKAIEAETRLRMLQEQREQHPESITQAQRDEVAEIEAQIEEIEASLPEAKDEKTFWARMQGYEKLNKLNRELSRAVKRSSEQAFANIQSGSVVQQFKSRYANDPVFRQIEGAWDQWVQQLEPNLRTNLGMLELLRKNLAFDYIQQNGGKVPQQKRSAPAPTAPSGAFTPQQQAAARTQKAQPAFKSEAEQRVAEFYGMTAEEYYSPQFNEVGPDTEGNGIQIMDLPAASRRTRRS